MTDSQKTAASETHSVEAPELALTPALALPIEVSHSSVDDRKSPWVILWSRLRRNRTAMAGLALLVFLYVGAILAGFLAPYHYETQHDKFGFHPPMIGRIHFHDQNGKLVRPFVYGITVVNPSLRGWEGYAEKTAEVYPIKFFVTGERYSLLGLFHTSIHLFGVDKPGLFYLLGSDLFGRDLFSRLMYGSQVSLSIGIVGILISTIIGMAIGGISGYLGGPADFLLMRLVEVLLAIPSLYFILILRQTFGTGLKSTQLYFLIVVILSFIGWATEARVIRGMVLSLKEKEFVLAAEALGFSKTRIVVKHILPNTLSFVIVTAALSVPFYIVSEVALSFLGVGIEEPQPSWGNMLSVVEQNVQYLRDYTWLLAPGVMIFLAVLAWNFFGDGLRDAADPRALN